MKILRFITFFAVVLSLSAQRVMAGPVHEVVTSFDSPPSGPSGPLVSGPDGFYWGTSEHGGLYNYGTIYKTKSDGSEWQIVVSFTFNGDSNKGSYPAAGLVSDGGGYLWGTTKYGGAESKGTIFKINVNTGALTTIVEFTDYGASKGSVPCCELLRDGVGFFWGTTLTGGASGRGTIFKVNAITGELTTLVEFTGNGASNKGSGPYAGLVNNGSGYLWGTTLSGGINNYGTVYKINTSNGQLSTLVEFSNNGANNKGRSPYARLVSDGAGFLWGTTVYGGANDRGTVFQFNTITGALTTLVEFTGNGANNKGSGPFGSLFNDGAGFLWGTTSSGGVSDRGTVFKINVNTGALTTLVGFTGNGSAYPRTGLIGGVSGTLLGVTRGGGASNYGTIFKIDLVTGVLTTLVDFATSSKGDTPYSGLVSDGMGFFWGTTKYGGTSGYGSIFKINVNTGLATTIVSFSNNDTSNKGSYPVAGLVDGGAGFLWGTTPYGGANNYGTVFKVNLNTGWMTTLVEFTGNGVSNKGQNPLARLVSDGAGFLWGTTSQGGAFSQGTVFKINVSSGALTTVVEFTGNSTNNKGANPSAELVNDGVGYFWGATDSGGIDSQGTIFKINASNGQMTTLFVFTGSGANINGRLPASGLTKDSSGFLWGTTMYGGASNNGTIFKMNANTGALTTMVEFSGKSGVNVGANPTAKLANDGIGFLWGTTEVGGAFGLNDGYGTVFKVNALTGELTTLFEFNDPEFYHGSTNPSSGSFPRSGALIKHTDGNFYGTTSAGGPGGRGNVFRLRRGPKAVTQPVSERTGTKATLNASVNPNDDGNTAVNYQYGTSSTLSGATTVSAGTVVNTSSVSQVSLQISGLAVGTTYYYRVLANNIGNEVIQQGDILSFVAADVTTEKPEMSLPATSTITKSPVSLAFNLPEAAANGALTLGFTGSATRTLVLDSSQRAAGAHSFSFNPANPTATAAIVSISGGTTLPDGVYTVTLSYQDVLSNPAATISSSNVRIDTTPPTFSLPTNLTVMATSAEGAIVAYSANALDTGGSGVSNSNFSPATSSTFPLGLTTVNASATDIAGNTASGSFSVTVQNNAPTISNVLDYSIVQNEIAVTTDLTVGDVETALNSLLITGSSSNTSLVPNTNIIFGGSGANRTATITPVLNKSGTTTITVTISDGEMSASDSFLVTVIGPEIEIERADGTSLQDGAASTNFSNVVVPASSLPVSYTVRNTGTSSLSGLILTKDGSHSEDFLLGGLGAATLAPGASTTFTVTFKPTASGVRIAGLHIGSNDTDENLFDIVLIGHGQEPPVFIVQPQSRLAFLGGPVSFDPTVTGDPVITYKWKKGTAFIPGSTASSYTILATKAADVGAYSVIADNPVGAEVLSSTAYLGLVTISHGMQTLKVGSTLKLICTVVAPKLLGVSVKYDWFRQGTVDPITNGTKLNGAIVSGATTGALSIAKIGAQDADIYTCRVTLDTPGNDPELNNGSIMVNVVDAVPDVATLPPESVSVSEPIDITITATNFPTSFSATALPVGLKFDSKTGRLTGKPTTPSKKNTLGAYIPSKISFKATNPFGTSVAEDFYLTIEPLVLGVVGTFNGIVSRSGHTNFGMGGHAKITVASTGIVSGDVTLAGQKHSVVGSLDVSLGNNPTFDLIIKRSPASLGNLRLTGAISPPDDLLSGDISDLRFEMLTGTQDLGDPAEPGLVDGTMEEARFNHPSGLALLANGSGYISDSGDHVIRFVDGDGGTVSTFAGNTNSGSNDGTGTAARFAGPEGLALDIAGNIFVADTLNSTIRKITPAGGVTTFAGTAGQIGNVNGTGAAARFELPCALCFDPAGNLYVADRGNHTIRKITQSGVVTTLAGKAGQSGHKDGSGASALFHTPRGIVYDPVLKALFVTDSENVVIRKITLAGATTTYAGSPGAGGIADGLFANARFINPRGITTLGDGTLIVTDTLLVQLNSNGTLGTVSDFLDTVGKLDHPVAVAYNPTDESLITVDPIFHGAISYEPSGVNQEAHFAATRNPWSATGNAPEQGIYNATIETTAAPDDASYAQGSGYAQVSISKAGIANWTGKAADGTAFTFSTFLDADLHIPLHASLYKNTGSLQGDTFINPATQDLVNHTTPAFDWYKIGQPLSSTDRSYKGGFLLHELTLTGGKYTPNDAHSYLGFSPVSGPAALKLDFTASLIAAFVQPFTLTKPNTVSITTPVKSTTLKIDPKTGIFTGSFKEGTPAVTVPFAGILIDYEAGSDKSGHGHYLLPESSAADVPIRSASMTLEPAGP